MYLVLVNLKIEGLVELNKNDIFLVFIRSNRKVCDVYKLMVIL